MSAQENAALARTIYDLNYADTATMLAQIGVLPQPQPRVATA